MIRRWKKTAVTLVTMSLLTSAAGAQQTGLPLQEGIPLDSTVVASGMFFPVGLVVLPDGSLLVGSSNPTGGSYFSSTGELLRLADMDADGALDAPGDVVATDLAGMVTAVAVQNDLVFVTSVEAGRERIQILRATVDWGGSYTLLGEITFAFRSFAHQSYGLATRTSSTDPSRIELYFNVGASGNETAGRSVAVGGLLDTTLIDASIFMTEVTDLGDSLSLSDPVQIASGLRNAMAFGFHLVTGDLWITDNGIDGFEDVWSAYSADELNVISADQIGGEVEDFGFPSSYTIYETGEIVGNQGIPPVVAFVLTGTAENEGVSAMAFTPPSFVPAFGDGVLVGFHGQYDMWDAANEENAVLFVDLGTFDVSTVVPPGSPGVGHINSLATGADAMYVADMCVGASLATDSACGVIYRIEPS